MITCLLQETTDWGSQGISNGIYALNQQGQLVGYTQGKEPLRIYAKPMKQFSQSRRKFVTIPLESIQGETILSSSMISTT